MSKSSKKIKIILIIDAIVLIVCVLGLYHNYHKAGLGADRHLLLEMVEEKIVIVDVKHSDLKAYFQPGDTLKMISGVDISSRSDIEFILDGYSVGDEITIQVNRAGEPLSLKIRLPEYYSTINNILQSFISIIFLILGVFTLYRFME